MFEDPTFWVLVGFAITIGLVFKPAGKLLTGGLDGRIARIRAQIDEAQKLREDAQKTLTEYKRLQRDAVREAENIVENAKTEAKHLREQAERDLRESLKRRESQAMEKIAQAEAKALRDVRDQTVELAVAATAKLLERKVDRPIADALFDESLKDLSGKLH